MVTTPTPNPLRDAFSRKSRPWAIRADLTPFVDSSGRCGRKPCRKRWPCLRRRRGRQGHADWGECWTRIGGKCVKVHLFVMTLGYSRRMYAAAAWDEKQPVFLHSHEEAFNYFGGAPHEKRQPEVGGARSGLRRLPLRVEPGLLGLQPVLRLPTAASSTLEALNQMQGRVGRQVRQAVHAGKVVRESRSSQHLPSGLDYEHHQPGGMSPKTA